MNQFLLFSPNGGQRLETLDGPLLERSRRRRRNRRSRTASLRRTPAA
jgi:hypothetical protein